MPTINVGKLFALTEEQQSSSEDTVVITEEEQKEKIEAVLGKRDLSDLASVTSAWRHPLSARFHEILEELGELHDRKQKDYGTLDDPFANVRGATEFGIPSYMGAFIAMNDCMQRIKSFSQKGNLEFGSVDNALRDLAVYSIIALVLFEEDQNGKN